MRARRVTVTALSTLGAALGLTPVAAHAGTGGSTIYVDNSNPQCVHVAGAGAGTKTTPFCDVSPAGAAAQPGDTVLVAPSATTYVGADWLTVGGPPPAVNGTAGHPITFKASGLGVKMGSAGCGGQGGFFLRGQHDLVIDGFSFSLCSGPGVYAENSQNITVVNSTFTEDYSQSGGAGEPGAAVYFGNVTGGAVSANTMSLWQDLEAVQLNGSSGIDVLHNTSTSIVDGQAWSSGFPGIYASGANNRILGNRIQGTTGPSIWIDSAGSATVVANNYLRCGGGGVQITGATNIAVADNTVVQDHGSEYQVTGAVQGVTIENSVGAVADQYDTCNPTMAVNQLTGVRVDAAAAPGTTLDYNALGIAGYSYEWAGKGYATPADLAAAGIHQGAHDQIGWVRLDQNGVPASGSIAIDSANTAAPGTQKTDLLGNARFDDPNTADTGSGSPVYADRGAFEFQGVATPGGPPPGTPPPTGGTPGGGTPPPTGGPTTQPSAGLPVYRVAGADRYTTALDVSMRQWQSGAAGAVVLAKGTNFPDALSGVPLAAHVHGPLLLTDSAALSQATSAEISRVLGADKSKTVYVLGGTGAISPQVEQQVRDLGYHVQRYGGNDRYATALQVAQSFGSTQHVIVATGQNFADALAAGPLGAVEGAPIVLSQGTGMDQATAAFVGGHAAIEAVGGQAVTAVGTVPGTAGKVTPLSGGDRYQTSARVAAQVATALGHTPTGAGVASGVNFPDALTGGAYAANASQPLLLTDPQILPTAIGDALAALTPHLATVTIFGGPSAVSGGVATTIAGRVGGTLASVF